MPSADRPAVRTIAAGAPFLDTLARHFIGQSKGDPLALARTLVLLPNRRAATSLGLALVQRAAPALPLPRMLPIADIAEALPPDLDLPDAPAVDPAEAALRMAGVLARAGTPPVRALREAAGLMQALGELVAWDASAADLAAIELERELADHWAKTLRRLELVVRAWPGLLAESGGMDAAAARVAAVRALCARWRARPGTAGRVVAAGFVQAPPFIAELLAVVARLPDGLVVLPGLDLAMDEATWAAIDPMGLHPQAPLKALLEGMGVARAEVGLLGDAPAGSAVARLLAGRAPVPPDTRPLACIEAAGPEQEAAVIALALREAIEEGRSCALVTPDRTLARRVAARLARWDVVVDDSAGTPLAATPAGTLARLALAAARPSACPAELVALLEHPLAGSRDARGDWLEAVRALDLAARALPQPHDAASLAQRLPPCYAGWWNAAMAALDGLRLAGPAAPDFWADALARTIDSISGGRCWTGADGRALSLCLEQFIAHGGAMPAIDAGDVAALLDVAFNAVSVRPPAGFGHPLVAIWGPLEARLQSAGLLVVGGLNEGTWPGEGMVDPWLPPFARTALGLPGDARRIALMTHDLGQWLSQPGRVLLTRALRDSQAPTVPSRFWLRLQAAGLLHPDARLGAWAAALDTAATRAPGIARPAPAPPPALRPRTVSASQLDLLRSDPFAIFARYVLGLRRLPGLGEAADARAQGLALHAGLAAWFEAGEPTDGLLACLEREAAQALRLDPVRYALWRPRLGRIATWAEREVAARRGRGWRFRASEVAAERALVGPIRLKGRADWVEEGPQGLEIIDFKTGSLPTTRALDAGFATQLGLLGALAQQARLGGEPATVTALSYWQLSGGHTPGKYRPVVQARGNSAVPHRLSATAFIDFCLAQARATACAYLLDGKPFTAKARPEFARMGDDFDHLARVEEWLAELYGEDGVATA